MRDLGTLGGRESYAYGINASGQVVGYSSLPDGSIHAFLWTNGVMKDLGTLGGNSYAYGINDVGQIVGEYVTSGTDPRQRAFVWSKGVMTDIGTLGGLDSIANAINASGQVVGFSAGTDNNQSHAFLWTNGVMTDLGGPGGLANAIADGNRQTVFLIHGIAQNGSESGDLRNLAASLRDPNYGPDPSRFVIDAGFDFGYCAATVYCSSDCTIQNGARALAIYINEKNPTGDIVLVGYSMGGLIARDMILNNYANVITNHHVAALVTLGTPHLGYPYEPIDGVPPLGLCNNLAGQMFGDFRNSADSAPPLPEVARGTSGMLAQDFRDSSGNNVALSGYLHDLNTRWAAGAFDHPESWYAFSGAFCSIPQIRTTDLFPPFRGCSEGTSNDGVVCVDSAASNVISGPTNLVRFFDVNYSHAASLSTFVLFCPTELSFALYDPPRDGGIISKITNLINRLP